MPFPLTAELKVITSAGFLARGCVNAICLEEISEQIGPRWERLKGAVWAHLEGLLRQRLSPTDFYVRVNDILCVVCSPSSSPEESQIFCLRIAHELRSAMLGDCNVNTIRIASVVGAGDEAIEIVPVSRDRLADLAVHAGIDNAAPAQPPPAAPRRATLLETPALHNFHPVWDSQKEVITTYRCVSRCDGEPARTGEVNAQLRAALALTADRIRFAAATLSAALAAGNRFLTWVPIHYELVTSPIGRMEISSICRSLSADLRPYLLFELTDLPHGMPQSRLADLVGLLRPFCRGVVAHLPARTANYGAYVGVGLFGIGLSLSAPASVGTEMTSEIFKLQTAAARQNIRSYVLDVANMEVLKAAIGMGVSFLTGSLIGKPVDRPDAIRRLALKDVVPSLAA